MLGGFDWIRRSETSAELLATLRLLHTRPDLFRREEIASPHSALDSPCRRCWVYPRGPAHNPGSYCPTCWAILGQAHRQYHVTKHVVAIWGRVEPLSVLQERQDFHADKHILAAYAPDESHVLLMMQKRQLQPWLQDLALYHGARILGLFQVLPPTGKSGGLTMADVLARAIHQANRFPLNSLRVRFFPSAHLLLKPQVRDQQGLLTFTLGDFLGLLETASVFRSLLQPDVQEVLLQLLNLRDPAEERFYWGRLLGLLRPEARDMLAAWGIRQWPKERIKLLYELREYVAYHSVN